jgi:uncharacterized protein (TIGR02145 family)
MKKIIMKNSFVSSWSHVVAIGSIASLALLTACGDNVTDNDPVATQAYEGQEDFPDCDKDYEGMFATVKSKQELYICTAEKWVNLTTGQAVSDKDGSGSTGCTSKELSDKSGVTVICNGDTVATLSYGKTGAKGSDGGTGDKGDKGTKGSDGSSFSGTTPTWDPDRCKLKNAGLDYMIFDCGDSTYVKQLVKASAYNSKRWNPLKNIGQITYNDYNVYTLYNDQFGEKASGDLVRFSEDDAGANSTVTRTSLYRDDAQIKGKASVVVKEEQTVTADKYRPFVGVKFTYNSTGTNIGGRAGVCLTYSSEKDMNLLIEGETGFVKAALPATKDGDVVKDTMVQLLWRDFEPVANSVDFDKVITSAKYAYVEAVGGTNKGTYENQFSVYQFGDYGKCDDYTATKWLAYLKGIEITTGSYTDTRTDTYNTKSVEYGTMTIGGKVWMTDDLKFATANTTCLGTAGVCEYGMKYTSAERTSVCPSADGWRIPTIREWGELFKIVSGEVNLTENPEPMTIFAALFKPERNGGQGKNLIGFNIDFYGTFSSSEDEYLTSTTSLVDIYGGTGRASLYNLREPESYTGWSSTQPGRIRCVKDADPATP